MRRTLIMTIFLAQTVPAIAGRRNVPVPTLEQTTPAVLGRALSAGPTTWERMEELCDGIGHRLAGTPMLEAAVDWAADHMQRDGLANVKKEPVEVSHWSRGEESLRLLGDHPRPLPMLGLGHSVGTQGVEAEVVVVSDYEQLELLGKAGIEGKIVLFDAPFDGYGKTVTYRVHGPSRAAKLGAVASLVRSISPTSLATPHTGTLIYADDGPKIPAAAVDIETATQLHRMVDRGLHPRVKLVMGAQEHGTVMSANVVGEIVGRELPEEIVVVGCHLDSWDVGQGAQDNAAGCVAAMEVGRVISALPHRPRRTIRVVLFTNEESGLMGGKTYAKVHANENHVAAIEMDTGAGPFLGYRVQAPAADRETQLAESTEAIRQLEPMQRHLAGMGDVQWLPSYAGSDVGPLIEQGALGFGLHMDTSGYWPIHHTKADTLDKIDPATFQRDVAGLALLAWTLGEWKDIPGGTVKP
ncbi:MAG: carboxypeptidase Q [Kiritimatiellia bacterium]|jgi:carboxypeptidase Q